MIDAAAHDELVKNLAATLKLQSGKPAHVYRTHISSVVTCGAYAYKLKRPVKLPFVDFSTLTLRRQDCRRELRVNQRTAPDLYLGVVKLTGSPERPRIGGTGKSLEWAVKMKRFDQAALLSNLIKHNSISVRMAESLGHHLASFSNALRGLKPHQIQAHRATLDWLLESLTEITAIVPAEHKSAAQIQSWAKQQARKHHRRINKRKEHGFYRNCHGDLHLANLVKLGTKVIAFDALEFNRELSQIDVVNDIAFAFMDLLAHSRADLAWSMVNQWCEHTGDYGGLPLLRFYSLYRAVVRAKVAALAHNAARAGGLHTFERYWLLASKLVAPANPPRLVLVAGLSGSGKSTVARELVAALSGIQVRADVVRKRLFSNHIHEPNKLYSHRATQKTYLELASIANTLLSSNMTVIVDATFLDNEHLRLFAQVANKHKIPLKAIVCEAPIDILKQRIRERAKQGIDPSDATATILEQQIERLHKTPMAWPVPPHRLDTSGSRALGKRRIRRLANMLLGQ